MPPRTCTRQAFGVWRLALGTQSVGAPPIQGRTKPYNAEITGQSRRERRGGYGETQEVVRMEGFSNAGVLEFSIEKPSHIESRE